MNRLAFISLCIFIFCLPWESAFLFSAFGTLSRAVGLAAALVCFVAIVRSGEIRVNGFAIISTLFLSYALLTILWSPYPDITIITIKGAFQKVAMLFLMHQFVYTSRDVRNIFFAFVLGCFVTALSTIYTFHTAPEIAATYHRFAPAGFEENDVALVLALGIIMAWHIVLTANVRIHRCVLAFVPIGFYASMLTGSRTGFVGTIIALTTPLVHFRNLSSRGKAAVLLGFFPLGAIVLVGFLHWIPDSTLMRIGTLTETASYSGPDALGGRALAWTAGLDMWARSPLIGNGAGTFAAQNAALHGVGINAHNAFVSVATELGLVGLLLFLLLLSMFINNVLTISNADRATWYLLVVVLMAVFMMGNWTWKKETWLLFALGTAYVSQSAPGYPNRAFLWRFSR